MKNPPFQNGRVFRFLKILNFSYCIGNYLVINFLNKIYAKDTYADRNLGFCVQNRIVNVNRRHATAMLATILFIAAGLIFFGLFFQSIDYFEEI